MTEMSADFQLKYVFPGIVIYQHVHPEVIIYG